jgi:triosephosphate isomerase (TIM)
MIQSKTIICNWKMQGSLDLVKTFTEQMSKANYKDKDVVICPPSIYLQSFAVNKCNFKLGVQNIHQLNNGAFTGEISAFMAKECGAEYVIIGHSERRAIFNETNSEILAKINISLKAGLVPIFCIGESHEDFQGNMLEETLATQLDILSYLDDAWKGSKIIIGYEPVWAIGTGLVPIENDILKAHTFIATYLKAANFHLNFSIIYGGSVNDINAQSILNIKYVDGLLIGGASLDVQKVINILSI